MRSESPSISSDCTADATSGGRPLSAAVRLYGPTRKLDPRTSAYRKDVADIALAGDLFAPHYAAPFERAAKGSAMMRSAPRDDSEAVSQLLPGEDFAVLDVTGGWAWGYSRHDHYVGYVAADLLGEPVEATHRISVREALIFADPSIKAPAIGTLPFGALIHASAQDDFVKTGAGFIHKRHVLPKTQQATDPVAMAELFLGMPYLWGGRGAGGIDCSGLVQVALAATGVGVPRDTDLQREAAGTPLADGDHLRRNDIVFFPGHVGLMIDESRLLHANAHWMSVVIEPLADVVARIASEHDRPILCRRRMTS